MMDHAGPRGLRLLFLVDTGFPTFRPDVLALFGTYLPRCGVLTDLVAQSNDAARPATGFWGGGAVFLAPRHPSRVRARIASFLHGCAVLRRAEAGRYDAIQIRNNVFLAPYAMYRARALGIPFFFWMSYPIAESAIRLAHQRGRTLGMVRRLALAISGYGGRALLHGVVLKHASHIIVQSDRMRSELAAQGIAPARMSPVPMGIDPDRFISAPPQMRDARLQGRRVIAYLGTCERVRRVDFLFDVVARLIPVVPHITLLLIGDAIEADDKAWLRQRIIAAGVSDAVVVTGWLAQDVAQSYLAAAEVALALMPPDPLLDSTTPTKLVEYLAMEKPVVANDHPDQRKVIEESGAGFCTALDDTAFADKLALLLSDADLRRSMAARGRDYVMAHRAYDSIAGGLAKIYASFAVPATADP